ncbi:adenosine monophosphate-protein transferase [Bradyrhizobium sp. LTSP849]|jgi:cell filamentation protein|uniref:Fic/DOC family protein n=1 Tax=Bradyrhizobium sp. LTSP849 TaxID=1615890 RepID=UPI0005D265DD|nr:Fic family protein [Bradyrhizobium sp. LTSP849]KJC53865.1 adenosine monophosphate-protein transferase [Bradyrhizobium sp. LTSP849]
MYDAIDDPYTYENSTVLVNKLDLLDQDDLDDFEAEISSARSAEPLPEGQLDFAHYCAVHHHLFQDVYEWAGMPRTVRMSKQGSPFCFPEHIDTQAAKLFLDLKADRFLENLPAAEFAAKAAHFLAELNVIHAFREGNGRSQLSFFAMLADRAGHPLDLERLDPGAMLDAMIASFDGDETELAQIIAGLVTV